MIRRLLRAATLLAALSGPSSGWSGEAQPLAQDPAFEARVVRLAEELRCLVCQNQTIADSHAPLANDLKVQIRELLGAGRTEAEVLQYMVDRYGDFVRYRPPVKTTTVALWLGPFALLAIGSVIAIAAVRRRRPTGAADGHSAAQHAQAAALLADQPGVSP